MKMLFPKTTKSTNADTNYKYGENYISVKEMDFNRPQNFVLDTSNHLQSIVCYIINIQSLKLTEYYKVWQNNTYIDIHIT